MVKNLCGEIIQTHRILVRTTTLLAIDQDLLLRECPIVLRTDTLLVDFFLFGLEPLEEALVNECFTLLKFSIVKVQEALECHESEQEFLFV